MSGLERALYRALLRAFPARFREAFGTPMEAAFDDERAAARERGRRHLAALWFRTATSLTWHGLSERTAGLGRFFGKTRNEKRGREDDAVMIEFFLHELRRGVRRLARQPSWTATAIGTIALGLGATTAVFSVVAGVVLSPLPYPEDDRLVAIGHAYPGGKSGMPDGGYLHYRDRAKTLVDIGLWIEASSAIAGTGEPLEVGIIRASRSLFSTLGIEPALGRGFVLADHRDGAPAVVIVSHGFWRQHLSGDPAAVGQPLPMEPTTTVVGVMPEHFDFDRPEAVVVFGNRFDAPDLYYPLGELNPSTARFGNFMYQSIGRLAPGSTTRDAQAELNELMLSAAEQYPGGFTPTELVEGGRRPVVAKLSDALTEDVRGVLWVILGSVGIGLLIAVANAASLFVVRAEARSAEMSIRRALGAGRVATTATFAAEAAIITTLGCGLGMVAAQLGTPALLSFAPYDMPRGELVGFGLPVLLFTAAVSLGVFCALVLVANTRDLGDLRSGLGSSGRNAGVGPARSRLRRTFMSVQVGMSLVLLLFSALLAQSFLNLTRVDPGFDPTGVLTMRLALPGSILSAGGFVDGPADRRRADFMLELTSRIEEAPGVEGVSYAADLPLDGDEFRDYVATEDAWPRDMNSTQRTLRVFIGPGYLRTIGATLIAGRELDRQDYEGQPRAVVVNESFARQRWPDSDPIGRRIAQYAPSVSPDDDVFYTVVGVVRDVREASLAEPPEATVYLPTVFLPEGDFYSFVSNMVLVVRSSGDPMAALDAARGITLDMRPDVPINNIASLSRIVDRSFADVSFAATLIAITALASLMLGIVGVYGTVSYLVSQMTRELGIRLALGASREAVSRSVLAVGARTALVGIGMGLLVAIPGARVLESWLFGVSPIEPLAYVAVSLALASAVMIASLGPARRASKIDPILAIESREWRSHGPPAVS